MHRVSVKSGKWEKSQGILLFLEKSGNLNKKSGKIQGIIKRTSNCRKISKLLWIAKLSDF